MLLKSIFSCILTVIAVEVFAQKGNIEGFITDAESWAPVNGAIINIVGIKGDNSDMFEKFSIPSINPGQYEMTISHVGYKTELAPAFTNIGGLIIK